MQIFLIGRESLGDVNKKGRTFFSRGNQRSQTSMWRLDSDLGRASGACMLWARSTPTRTPPAPSLFQIDFSHCSFPEAVTGCPFSNRVVGTLPDGKVSRAPESGLSTRDYVVLHRARGRQLERVHESFRVMSRRWQIHSWVL